MCSLKVIVITICAFAILICLILKNKEILKPSPYPLPKNHNQIFQGQIKCRHDIKKGIRPGNSPYRRRA